MVDRSLDRVETGCRVLLVDDRPERRALMRMLLETGPGAGTVVAEATNVAAAVAAVQAETVDAAVVEIQMPLAVGLAVIAALRAERPALVLVVCSFHADPATRQKATAAGVDTYLPKPVSPADLLRACALPRHVSAGSSDDIASGPDSDSSPDLDDRSADHQPVTQCSSS